MAKSHPRALSTYSVCSIQSLRALVPLRATLSATVPAILFVALIPTMFTASDVGAETEHLLAEPNHPFRAAFWSAIFSSPRGAPMRRFEGQYGSGEIRVELELSLSKVGDTHTESVKVDTGSDALFLARSQWNQALLSHGREMITGASRAPFACERVQVTEVRLGSYAQQPQFVNRCDLGAQGSLLGLSFFSGHSLTLNFEENKICIVPTNDTGASSSACVPQVQEERLAHASYLTAPAQRLHDYRGTHIGIDVRIGDEERRGIFDTGSELTAFDQTYVDAHPAGFEYVKNLSAQDSSGKSLAVNLYKLKELTIAGRRLHDLYVISFDWGDELRRYFGGNETPMIVGYNAITRMGGWHLDLEQKTWSAW